MGTKAEELAKMARGEGCLGKAADDEPIFILRARDRSAGDIVRKWAEQRAQDVIHDFKPIGDIESVREAINLAYAMDEWHHADRIRRVNAELRADPGFEPAPPHLPDLILVRGDLCEDVRGKPADRVTLADFTCDRSLLDEARRVVFIDMDGSTILLKDRDNPLPAEPPPCPTCGTAGPGACSRVDCPRLPARPEE